ncbi:MAG: hypothetical protein N2117_14920, partial [Anaerolineales bacterium]|nr:hypothetical protein [Anaerolineales bacterium]
PAGRNHLRTPAIPDCYLQKATTQCLCHPARLILPSAGGFAHRVDSYKNPLFPGMIHLFAQRQDGKPLDPNSLNLVESTLSQLLAIEGNDPRLADDYMRRIIEKGINDLPTLGNVLELPLTGNGYHIRIPSGWQTDVVPVEVGSASSK